MLLLLFIYNKVLGSPCGPNPEQSLSLNPWGSLSCNSSFVVFIRRHTAFRARNPSPKDVRQSHHSAWVLWASSLMRSVWVHPGNAAHHQTVPRTPWPQGASSSPPGVVLLQDHRASSIDIACDGLSSSFHCWRVPTGWPLKTTSAVLRFEWLRIEWLDTFIDRFFFNRHK